MSGFLFFTSAAKVSFHIFLNHFSNTEVDFNEIMKASLFSLFTFEPSPNVNFSLGGANRIRITRSENVIFKLEGLPFNFDGSLYICDGPDFINI